MIRLSILILLLSFIVQNGNAEVATLFASDEPLEITIEMPLNTIIKKAKHKPEVPGSLQFVGPDGSVRSVDMTMTTRGRSRLDHCRFPPLKINFKSGQLKESVFEGQNKLKIVTHCRKGSQYVRYLRQEFGIYKAYNELTDFSFRVRWARINYLDSEGKRKSESHDAFFIESNRGVAERLASERVTQSALKASQLDPVESNKYELFQYLIANTDWSMLRGPSDEGCCHNGKVLDTSSINEALVVLPYDFDQAGLMNTKYSFPDPALKLRSVRQRLYRGRCRHNNMLEDTIRLFNERRQVLEQYLAPDTIDEREQKKALKYVDAFFEIVNDPKKRQRYLADACVGR